MNTRWGRAGWGRTPGSLRRHQAPPSFLHRHDSERDIDMIATRNEVRFAARGIDTDFELDNEWIASNLEPSA
jgi:hypothetical protein